MRVFLIFLAAGLIWQDLWPLVPFVLAFWLLYEFLILVLSGVIRDVGALLRGED